MVPSARVLVVSCCVALISACGGGHGDVSPMPPPASAGQVTVAGTLAGTPSALQIGGQPVDTTASAVTVNGRPGSAEDLQPGAILHGRGTRSGSGIHLTSADVRPDLCGPISVVDVAGGKLTVLGTVVTVDALTVLVQQGAGHVFTTIALADFKVGDVARVYGSVQTDGSFLATRVERRLAGPVDSMELRGTVASLDDTAKTFLVGPVTVTYGTAAVEGTLVNGVRVEVRGTLSGTTFTATKVEVETNTEDDPGSAMEVRGPVSMLDATAKTFTLLTFKVDYGTAVVTGTLVDGAVVEVEGNLSATAAGTILATRVEVRLHRHGSGSSDGEAKGAITALNATDLTLSLGGTTYWTDAQTVFLREEDTALAFTDLKVGDSVEVRTLSSKTNAAGQAYASRVEVEGRH